MMGQSPKYRQRHEYIVDRTIEAANEWVTRYGNMPTWEEIEESSGVQKSLIRNVFGLISSPIGIILERRLVSSIGYAIGSGEHLVDQLINFAGYYRSYLDAMPIATIESLTEIWLTWLEASGDLLIGRVRELVMELLRGVPQVDVERDSAELHDLLAS